MRDDAIGFFWRDLPTKRGQIARQQPPIPDTGWLPPREYPNLAGAKALCIDVETYDPDLEKHGPGWARGKGHIVGAAVGTDDGHRWYFPIRHTVEPEWNLDPGHTLAWLAHTLAGPQPKLGANIIYDIGWLRQEGVFVAGDLMDVQYAEALLHERGNVALDDLGEKYLGRGKDTNLLYKWCADYYGGNPTDIQRKNIYRTPPRLTGPYAEGDVDLPFHIMHKQWPQLVREGLMPVFKLECMLIQLMVEMRFAGVTVDVEQAHAVRAMLVKHNDKLHDKLRQELGFHVEVDSGRSLARVFDVLRLPYSMTAHGNPSFTAPFLERQEHPLVEDILAIRRNDKLIGTFLDGYIINSHVNGKVYGEFIQLRSDGGGARSGRMASAHPNLQNIPTRTKLGKRMRQIYVPDPGHGEWLKVDYSQIEYRCLAHFATGPGADELRSRYINDPLVDFHELIRELVLQLTGQNHERGPIKTINFGLLYGMGPHKLIAQLGVSKKVGKELFESYHKGAPFIKVTFDAASDEAARTGIMTTVLGRRSRFDLWEPAEYGKGGRGHALPYEEAVRQYFNPKRAYTHKALNRRLQGSAADIIKVAMLKCWRDGIFAATGVPRLMVHDELDFSVVDPQGSAQAFGAMKHTMETALPLRVPVQAVMSRGANWGAAA